tara:strand:- start:1434 stop:2240 length:807 start_codon:yes stop_codon:yes gene_type:complete
MPLAEVTTGTKIFYESSGQGDPLLLIPGTGGSLSVWQAQIPEWSSDLQCIAVDIRGGGRSEKPDAPYSVRLLAEDMIGILDVLGLEKAHIAGLSLGSAIAQEIGINFPNRTITLSLHNTWARTDRWLRIRFEVSKFLLQNAPWELSEGYRQLTLFSPDKVNKVSSSSGRNEPESSEVKAKIRLYDADIKHDTLDRLHMIKAPTLVTTGEEDNCLPPRYAMEVHKHIPNSIFHFFSGSGSSHMVCGERPQEFNEVQKSFLRSVVDISSS